MKGRHILVGAVALVVLAGCSGSDDKTPEVKVSPPSSAAQDAYVKQLRAIDSKLAGDPEAAVAKGQTICSDIAKNLRWNQIEANAESTFGAGADETDRIMQMTQDVLCGK